MTVPTTTSSVEYTGTGLVSVFPYTWQIAQATDLIVYKRDTTGLGSLLTLTTDYTVSGVGVATGGNVTLLAGNLTSGWKVLIASDPAQIQQLLLTQGGQTDPASVMAALDLLTREVQANRRLAGNSLQFPVAESLDSLTATLPAAANRANKTLSFDASGNATVLSGVVVTSSVVPVETIDQIIDTVALLKALAKPATAVTYLVRGYYAAGDGGGGQYRWNSGDSTTDNGGSVLQANAGGVGRWNLLTTSSVSIRQFGAKSDGTDASAAIQAALTAFSTVNVPTGTFTTGTVLAVTAKLIGLGWDCVLKQGASDNKLLDLQTGNVEVRNLTLTGATANTDTNMHAISSAFATLPATVVIDNVQINGTDSSHGFTSGIYMVGVQGAQVTNCRIRNIRGTSAANGIFLDGNRPVNSQDVASAATVSLPSTGNLFRITGTTGISAISEGANTSTVITIAFAGALTVTNGAPLTLLNGVNYATTAEPVLNYPSDFLVLAKVSAGVWTQIDYHTQCSNFCKVLNNDIEFQTGALDSARFGYCGICMRNGGTGNLIADNRIRYGNQVQISVVSTTNFLDKFRGNIIRNNRLYDLTAPVVSSFGYQEAAIELGGRAEENVVSGNYIRRANRYGIWYSEDGTYNSDGHNVITDNIVVESYLHGIVVAGTHRTIIANNIFRDCGVNAANVSHAIFMQPQPQSGALECVDIQVNDNIVYGPVWTASGIFIYNPSALQSARVSLQGNSITTAGTPIVDNGAATRRVKQTSNTRFPFLNALSGYKTFANNTATSIVRVNVPNLKVVGELVIRYVVNSNEQWRVASGEYRVLFGRFTGQDTGKTGSDTVTQATALAGGTETFTSGPAWTLTGLTGSSANPQTFDIQCALNSDSTLATNVHFTAQLITDSYTASDETAEPSLTAV